MTRDQAIEKVRKLREMTVERGATAAEAKAAEGRADRLIKRFALLPHDIAVGPPPPPVPPPMPPPAPPSPAGWIIINVGGWAPTNTNTANRNSFTVNW